MNAVSSKGVRSANGDRIGGPSKQRTQPKRQRYDLGSRGPGARQVRQPKPNGDDEQNLIVARRMRRRQEGRHQQGHQLEILRNL